jgi:hypothetical protein
MKDRLKFIEHTKDRHGNEVVYFRRNHGGRIRLPLFDDPKFNDAYHAAFNSRTIPHVRDMPTLEYKQKLKVERYFKSALPRARKRAKRKGVEFALTMKWCLAQVESQHFRCALTGIEFFAKHEATSVRNPYGPSIDRIDCRRGYTPDNVRLVVFAINAMLMDWGTDIFTQVANSYRYRAQKGNYIYPHLYGVWRRRPAPKK